MKKIYPFFIILEDDVIPYKNFFKFVKLNLNKLVKNRNIGAICGYQIKEINNLKINFKKVDHNKNFQKIQFRVLKRKLNLFY